MLVSFTRTNSPRGYAFLFLREGDESPFGFAATFCKIFIFYQKPLSPCYASFDSAELNFNYHPNTTLHSRASITAQRAAEYSTAAV